MVPRGAAAGLFEERRERRGAGKSTLMSVCCCLMMLGYHRTRLTRNSYARVKPIEAITEASVRKDTVPEGSADMTAPSRAVRTRFRIVE